MDLGLQGSVALVCGGSRGIGKGISMALGRAGAIPCILSRNEESVSRAVRDVEEQTGGRAVGLVGDVADVATPGRVVRRITEQLGRLDILINNCGGPPMGSLLEHDDAAWQAAFTENLLSVVRFSREVVPHFTARGSGRIINITSLTAKEPTPLMVLSAAMRAGVSAITKALATELAPTGVTVNTVCPSAVLTERAEALTRSSAQRQGISFDEALAKAEAGLPMGRLASPEEIADLVVFLASARAAYITGTSIMFDGGLSRSIF